MHFFFFDWEKCNALRQNFVCLFFASRPIFSIPQNGSIASLYDKSDFTDLPRLYAPGFLKQTFSFFVLSGLTELFSIFFGFFFINLERQEV